MKILTQLLLLLIPMGLSAQDKAIDLSAHVDFFRTQSSHYQSWLESTRLNQAFLMREVQVSSRGEGVILNLEFVPTDPKLVAATWLAAKSTFEAENMLDLEEALFLKMVRLFDLRSNQALLQIRNNYTGLGEQYYVRIYTVEDHLEVEKNFFKGFFDKIDISLKQVSREASDQRLVGAGPRSRIYDLIRQFVSQEYGQSKNCTGQAPTIDAFYSMKDKLLISVSGLCRQVLTKEEDLLFCNILDRLGWDCESVKREELHFEFDFDEQSNRIYVQLDGKYSNDYLLFHGEVKDMDDDPRFEKLLQTHGENFLKALKLWIEQK